MGLQSLTKTKYQQVRHSNIMNVPPSFLSHFVRDGHVWVDTKRADDDVEDGLWRIHDTLYDLTNFAKRHPGGEDWITFTKGMDITELVESHHIYQDKLTPYLKKYRVRETKKPRNSKLTFEKDGFYVKLRNKVAEKLPNIVKTTPKLLSKIYVDLLFAFSMIFLLAGLRYHNYVFAFIGALLYTWAGVSGHNFLHQKDNYRKYYLSLIYLSQRDWKVTHVFSHHMFPNSYLDVETMLFEPLFIWTPQGEYKNVIQRFGSWIYGPIVFFFVYTLEFGKKLIKSILVKNTMYLDDFIPLVVPVFLYALGGQPLWYTLKWYIYVMAVSSFIFALIALNAGHHHPESVHDGDVIVSSYDWGLYNVNTVVDRADIRGNPVLVMANFGDHCLHHLFPTIDHGILPELYDILFETLEEFECELGCYPYWETIRGNFAQMARTKPTEIDSHEIYRRKNAKKSNGVAKIANGNDVISNGYSDAPIAEK